jgi:hypothetical protein
MMPIASHLLYTNNWIRYQRDAYPQISKDYCHTLELYHLIEQQGHAGHEVNGSQS